MTRLELAILKWAPVRYLTRKSKDVILPGFDGLSLYEVAQFFFREIKNNKLNVRCAAAAYNFIMAIPPTMLFLFSLVPYLPLQDVQNTILNTLRLVTPNERIYNNVAIVINDFMNNERADVLSFGVLLTIFFSSNGMMGIIRSFERSLPVYVERSGLKRRWTAIKMTFLLLGVALLTITALILQSAVMNDILLKIFNNTVVIRLTSLIIIIAIVFSSIGIIYRYGPSLTRRFRFVSAGAVFATILFLLTTTVFFFLVNNFINYNKVYGPIGTLIALMVWIWLNTLVILLGYELNVSILLGKIARKKDDNVEEAS